MKQKGVSSIIATIVLIFIIFAIAALLMASIASRPSPTPPYSGEFVIENVTVGKNVIVVKHVSGDPCYDAFDYVDNDAAKTDTIRNLEVKLNGVMQDNIIYLVSEGKEYDTEDNTKISSVKLVVNDLFKVGLDRALMKGDKIALIYQKKLLIEITI